MRLLKNTSFLLFILITGTTFAQSKKNTAPQLNIFTPTKVKGHYGAQLGPKGAEVVYTSVINYGNFDQAEPIVKEESVPNTPSIAPAEISIGEMINLPAGFTANVFPNPAYEVLNVNLKSRIADRVSIQLIDINGNVLYNRTSEESTDIADQITLTGLPQGNYILRLYGIQQKFTQSFQVKKLGN